MGDQTKWNRSTGTLAGGIAAGGAGHAGGFMAVRATPRNVSLDRDGGGRVFFDIRERLYEGQSHRRPDGV